MFPESVYFYWNTHYFVKMLVYILVEYNHNYAAQYRERSELAKEYV